MADSDHKVRIETELSDGFLLSEKLMLAVVVVLAAALVFVLGRDIYDRWYFMWLRRRERELHRLRPVPRIHNVLYGTNVLHHIVDRGLERVVLSSLPVFLFPGKTQEEPPQVCTVCLLEFQKDDIIRLLPKCDHSFHVDCIDMWFHSHSTCPLCRSWVERVAKPVQIPCKHGSSSDHAGGESASAEEGENGDTEAADWETVSSPSPGRFEYYLEDEDLAPCSGASQELRFSRSRLMSLKRILSMNSKPSDGGAGATCLELECVELTREPNHVHTPIG